VIIEQIFNWFLSIGTWAISLLPSNGDLFKTVPTLDITIFKYISLVDGYFPITELGKVMALMITISIAMGAIRLSQWAYNYLTKLIP
jgi:hypothetical protein